MSSILIFRQANRVTMLTDGSAYSFDGTLLGETPKAMPLPHVNAAIAVRGSAAALALVGSHLAREVSAYDDIEQALPEVLGLITPDGETGSGDAVDVYVAGWGAAGPDSYVMANHSFHADVPKLTATRTGPLCVGPGDAAFMQKLVAMKPADAPTIDDVDPEKFGLEIMEAQRREKFEIQWQAFGDKFHVVGSFCQVTTIWPERIDTRILKRWPDRKGEPIAD